MADYWLLNWLDSRRIRSRHEAASLISKPSVIRELRDLSDEWSNLAGTAPSGLNLVAGTGLRLDDLLTCPNPSCRKEYVDILFRHAWHYFDSILLPDGFGELLRGRQTHWPRSYWEGLLLDSIDVTLYLRSIGASALVSYYSRERIGESHEELHEGATGKRWSRAWSEIASEFATRSDLTFESLGHGRYQMLGKDPFLDSTWRLRSRGKKADVFKELNQAFIDLRLRSHIDELIRDLTAARELRGTLGSAISSHERVLTQLSIGDSTANVLFRLSLPSIGRVPINELISLRVHEGDAFAAFRQGLSKATKEMIASRGPEDPIALGEALVRDFVEPEIAKLSQRLKAARRTLARKVAFSLPIAAVSAVCGLHLGINPFAAGAAGLIFSGAEGAAAKYSEEVQSIEMSDMFFLWKALQHVD